MNYKIRPIGKPDLPELIVMLNEHATYEQAVFTPEDKKDQLSVALFGDPALLFCEVVESDGHLLGFVSYTFDFSTWDASVFMYLDCLFLRQHARGYGIGVDILNKLKIIAASRNCINIQWQTPEFNQRVISFYQRNGGILKQKARFTFPLEL